MAVFICVHVGCLTSGPLSQLNGVFESLRLKARRKACRCAVQLKGDQAAVCASAEHDRSAKLLERPAVPTFAR